MSARVWFAIVIASASVAGASVATASPAVYMKAELPAGQMPRLEATVIDGPHTLLSSFALRTDAGVTVPATSVRSYAQGNEAIAIAIVFERPLDWGELEALRPEQALFAALPDALDRLGLASRVPAGSEAALVEYGAGATVRMALSPIAELRGSTLATKRAPRVPAGSYRLCSRATLRSVSAVHKRDRFGGHIARGVELGLDELERSAAPIKVLIVISHGGGNFPDGANILRSLKKRAMMSNIRTFGILHQATTAAYADAITAMIPEPIRIESGHGLLNALQKVFADATDRYYLTFASEALPWDGKDHDFYVVASGVEFDPVTLTMPVRMLPWWRAWSAQIGLALGLLALSLLRARWRFAAAH